MIKAITASTFEIDDGNRAVEDILSQLEFDNKVLRKHSIGILSCYAEFIESGVVRMLSEALPFDIIGTTTIACGTPQASGETVLSIMVLTSDDVEFSTSLSEPVYEEDEAVFATMYEAASTKLSGKPKLLLSFVPLLTTVGSDFYVDCMTKISGNVPNFGTLAVDHNQDYHESRVILNAESWPDRYAILLMSGNVEPAFFIGTISDDKVFPEKGAVTASKGNQLQAIDGKPAVEYLLSLGLEKNAEGTITGINSFPIVVDYNDGTTPVVRAMFAITPEGHVVCGGNIPVGSTISMGSFDPEEIKATTIAAIQTAIEKCPNASYLIYSCIGRFFAQGFDQAAEMNAGNAVLNTAENAFLAAYSGGELCPVYTTGGSTMNRNHNNSFVICAI
ncbi:FIST C-terminal domain-containing protein [Ruminococcaceae bacterium OttesenSCG-928-I18]|nr:FIST C-terminal domain-containing protein [Ruminococcaceae bacterium OttesenSCG-928-I18]